MEGQIGENGSRNLKKLEFISMFLGSLNSYPSLFLPLKVIWRSFKNVLKVKLLENCLMVWKNFAGFRSHWIRGYLTFITSVGKSNRGKWIKKSVNIYKYVYGVVNSNPSLLLPLSVIWRSNIKIGLRIVDCLGHWIWIRGLILLITSDLMPLEL